MREKPLPLPEGTLVPNHIAFIPDGNRRWARARGLPAFEGHRRGFDLTPALAKACRSFGVHTVTVWAFSTENWDRSKEEIAFLMKKYGDFLDQHLKEAKKDKVRIFHLGRKDRIPPSLAKKLIQAEEETKSNSKYVLNVALDYGGRDDILRAIRKISEKGNMPQGLDEETFPLYLDTSAQPYPYPDLLIRTSAEQRFSGLLAWQMAYTELYWLPDHFPEITAEKIREAIIDFSRRRRRFGGNDLVPRVKFDPGKVAALEIGFWQAHNENDHKKLLDCLTGWLRELYDLKPEDALKIAKIMVAAAEYHNKRDWEKVAKTLGDAYKLLKEETGYVFTPEVAAELETNWWRIHDELEDSPDKEALEKAFRDLYGEIYRQSELQCRRLAHFKAIATFEHDLAEKDGKKEEQNRHWKNAEEYLVKCYQALREIAS